jgi:hypothetical protein
MKMAIPRFRTLSLSVAMAAYLSGAVSVDGVAYAQDRQDSPRSERGGDNWSSRDCDRFENRDSRWCRRDRDDDRRRREKERDRHKDDVAKGAVAGAVGVLLVGGIVAALASSGKDKEKRARERRRYCVDRYGSYDERTDTYRASDGRWYPCE